MPETWMVSSIKTLPEYMTSMWWSTWLMLYDGVWAETFPKGSISGKSTSAKNAVTTKIALICITQISPKRKFSLMLCHVIYLLLPKTTLYLALQQTHLFFSIVVVAAKSLYTTTTSRLCKGLLFCAKVGFRLHAGCASHHKQKKEKFLIYCYIKARIIGFDGKPLNNKWLIA